MPPSLASPRAPCSSTDCQNKVRHLAQSMAVDPKNAFRHMACLASSCSTSADTFARQKHHQPWRKCMAREAQSGQPWLEALFVSSRPHAFWLPALALHIRPSGTRHRNSQRSCADLRATSGNRCTFLFSCDSLACSTTCFTKAHIRISAPDRIRQLYDLVHSLMVCRPFNLRQCGQFRFNWLLGAYDVVGLQDIRCTREKLIVPAIFCNRIDKLLLGKVSKVSFPSIEQEDYLRRTNHRRWVKHSQYRQFFLNSVPGYFLHAFCSPSL